MMHVDGVSLGRLPVGFYWEPLCPGLRIMLGECEILRIATRKSGWVLCVSLHELTTRDVAVGSPRDGAVWARRWTYENQAAIRSACAHRNAMASAAAVLTAADEQHAS